MNKRDEQERRKQQLQRGGSSKGRSRAGPFRAVPGVKRSARHARCALLLVPLHSTGIKRARCAAALLPFSFLSVRPAGGPGRGVMEEQARARRRRASEICWLGRPAPWSPAPSRSHAPLLAAAKQHVRSRITRAPAASCMQACKQAGCTQSLDRPSEQRRSHEASE
jgi:hypothetical protein